MGLMDLVRWLGHATAPIFRNDVLVRTEGFLQNNPLLWCLVWVPVLVLPFAVMAWSPRLWRALSLQRWLFVLLSVITIAAAVGMPWRYVITSWYFDHREPNTAQMSWYFWTGRPIYPPLDGPEYFNAPYGPYLYVLNGAMLGRFGPSIAASKVLAAGAAVFTVALAWITFRREAGSAAAFCLVGLMTALLLDYTHFSFWARADPLLILFVMVGLFAATSGSKAAPVLLGLAAGVCVDLKPHAFAYFLPIVVIAARRAFDRRRFTIAAASCVVAALAPFVFPSVSLVTYVRLLMLAGKSGISMETYFAVWQWIVGLFLPIAVLVIWSLMQNRDAAVDSIARKNRTLLLATGAGALMILPPASHPGSGSWHLLPYIPVVLFVALELYRSGGISLTWPRSTGGALMHAMAYSWLLCVFGIAMWNLRDLQWQTTKSGMNERGHAILADIRQIQTTYRSRYWILMGTGDDERYSDTWYRTDLVFKGSPIGIDSIATMDFYGLDAGPDLHRLAAWLATRPGAHKSILWLVPKDQQPFSMHSFLAPDFQGWNSYRMYPQKIRDDFARLFPVRLPTSAFFDLYADRP